MNVFRPELRCLGGKDSDRPVSDTLMRSNGIIVADNASSGVLEEYRASKQATGEQP